MLLDRRAALIAAVLLILTGAACASVQSSSAGQSASVAAASPAPLATPNPDEAAGLVTRFYRDIDADSKSSAADLGTIISPNFARDHRSDLTADYLFIREPKVQIRDVHGRVVSYALDYVYVAGKGGKLFWERSGRWTLSHGAQLGWVLDNDSWDSVHLVAVSNSEHPEATPVQDKVYSDGRHEFTYEGATLSFVAKGDSWHISAVTRPTPLPAPATPSNAAGPYAAGEEGAAASAATNALPPAVPSADCEEVSVQDVYDDGKILALDDGRHLSVADYDTPASSVWVAPFDGLICNGERFINKDENEGVDLAE